mgnify:CR=1 FL=1
MLIAEVGDEVSQRCRLGSDGVFCLVNPTHQLSNLYRKLAAIVTDKAS